MWVDTYKEGHVGQSYATYTWRDYFAHHGVWDILSRLLHGLWNIYFRIPIMMEKVPLLYFLSIGGVWIAFRERAREYRFLCLFLVLQMQPLVWTNLSNPTSRVPYGSMLPFELFLAALFLAWASKRFGAKDSGYRIQESGFRIQESGVRSQDSGVRPPHWGTRVKI
jgi:hypothetical protein